MHKLQQLKMMVDNKQECDEFIKECLEEFKDSKQNIRGLYTLIIRNYINKKDTINLKNILYNNKNLMRRDYLSSLDYFLKLDTKLYYQDIEYIYNNIDDIETKDVDLMIENKWIDLLKKFDGYNITCTYANNLNANNKSKLKKYKFDVTKMRDKYYQRIKNREEMDSLMINCDVLIDGANMGHLTGKFDFTILPIIIKKFNKLNIKAKIILHERHQLESNLFNELAPYLIRTPTMRNDDDYMIYGMLIHNLMVLTNDMFRDHLKDMDLKTKCYVRSMSIKYSNNNLIIPKYSKCIQVFEKSIAIPTNNGFHEIFF
jgi:hypothetical protein